MANVKLSPEVRSMSLMPVLSYPSHRALAKKSHQHSQAAESYQMSSQDALPRAAQRSPHPAPLRRERQDPLSTPASRGPARDDTHPREACPPPQDQATAALKKSAHPCFQDCAAFAQDTPAA